MIKKNDVYNLRHEIFKLYEDNQSIYNGQCKYRGDKDYETGVSYGIVCGLFRTLEMLDDLLQES